MEELLFELTPAEWWVWNYLVLLARRQGSYHIILPRPGEDPRAEKTFCRKHLKNLLKSLKGKRRLTHLIIPRSKNKRIEVLIPASKIGELGFPNVEKGYLEFPKEEGLRNRGSPKATLGKFQTPIKEVITASLPSGGANQLSLREVIEKVLELSQEDLGKTLKGLGWERLEEVKSWLSLLVTVRPKGKNLSQAARVFAMVRFMQSSKTIERPQAWIDSVARAAEKELWKEGESGKSGRSQSHGGSGVTSASMWGRL